MGYKEIEQERQLVMEIVGGSEEAFSILFFKYIPVLQPFAFKFTKSDHDAEEIIQDAFLRIWLNRDKLEHVENVKAYIYKYVSNECLSYIRKKVRQEKVVQLFKNQHTNSSNVTVEAIELNELTRLVSEVVDKLPLQRKKVYELSRCEGKTIPEISSILGLSPNTVKNTLVTALKNIRLNLIQHGISLFFLLIFSM